MQTTDSDFEALLRTRLAGLVTEGDELEQQAAKIASRRKVNRDQQQAIRVLLGEDQVEEAQSSPRIEGGDLAGVPFREGWRAVLDDQWRKPAEIAQAMQERGYSDDATTSLATRVGNDLWRQAKKGNVDKKPGGYYRRSSKEPR